MSSKNKKKKVIDLGTKEGEDYLRKKTEKVRKLSFRRSLFKKT